MSYDWSNAKAQWAAATPMDCEERLLKQAEMTKTSSKNRTKVFVYRNVVKALPWYKSVRDKLIDPAYSGWFVRFSGDDNYHVPDCAVENTSKCSPFYHDQEQTPEVPTPQDPNPDGKCTVEGCDCGPDLPCGEYIFDHRNGSMLRSWIVEELFLSPNGIGSSFVDGFFMDDYWCSDVLCEASENHLSGCPCADPVQGPTEVDRNFQTDTQLSDADIRDMTLAWNETMTAIETAILRRGGYTWWLMDGQENANASPKMLSTNASQCISTMRAACAQGALTHERPTLFGLSVVNQTVLANPMYDLAYFLLARGDYGWIGWGVWGYVRSMPLKCDFFFRCDATHDPRQDDVAIQFRTSTRRAPSSPARGAVSGYSPNRLRRARG